MMQLSALGMFFKAISWSIAYIFLAKGANKVFFWNELINNAYTLGLTLVGYYLAGLTGIGLAFIVSYLLYTVQGFWVSQIYFEFTIEKSLIKIFTIQLSLALAGFLSMRILDQPFNYIAGSILFCASGLYTLKELDKRLGIKEMIRKFIK
jgi:O-antigen/teichoic acid export membrane protein